MDDIASPHFDRNPGQDLPKAFAGWRRSKKQQLVVRYYFRPKEWRPQHTKPQWTTPQTTPSANQPSPSPSKGPTLLGQGAMPTPALVSCPPLPMTLPPLEDFLASPDRDHLSFQAHPTWPCYT